MRVLLGSLTDISHLAIALVERGLDVHLLQPTRADLGEFGQTRPVAATGLPYALHLSPVFPRRPYPYSLYLTSLRRLLRRVAPDVVYLIGEPSELGAAQLVKAVKRYTSAPVALYSYENVDRDWRGFPRSLRGRAEAATLHRADLMLAGSHTAAARLQRLGYPADRIRVVYAGARSELCYPRDASETRETLGLTPDSFLIGYVGRIVEEKGIDLLLRALVALPAHFRLALIGSGPAEPTLRALADDLNVAERVSWLGRLPREQVALHHAAFDTLVLPSRGIPDWQEQFGAVMPEAMLTGTPVIGSTSGGIPEVIGDAGLTFPENDAEALASTIRRLASDPKLRQELAQKGRQRALAYFTWQKHYDDTAQALAELGKLPPRGTANY